MLIFPPLRGTDLCVVHKKKATAGSLDGWGWRDLQALLIAWFEWLAVILVRVEFDGVWVQGLLDAYIAMISMFDGDAAPIVQRPQCVLPVVCGRRIGSGALRLGSNLGCPLLFVVLVVGVVLLKLGIPLSHDNAKFLVRFQ